jgi:vacuolar-type H+-ATPase subunit H
MCHFISWVEYGGKVYCLPEKELVTKEGKELEKYVWDRNGLLGHGAIRQYWGLRGRTGKDYEITDFSQEGQKQMPKEIVKLIKEGQFNYVCCEELLTAKGLEKHKKIDLPAWFNYKDIQQPALAKYEKIKVSALADYRKKKASALAKCEKIEHSAWAEYKKIIQPAREEYEKIEQSACAEYEKIILPAREEYEKIMQPALADYERIAQAAYSKIFKDKRNRSKIWR